MTQQVGFEEHQQHGPVMLRGRLISEMSREELIILHEQIDRELPDDIDKLTNADIAKMYEMEAIEDELTSR
jgi:hypothetical protein